MKVDITKSGTGAQVRLGGSMYVEDSASVREQLIGLIEDGMVHLTVDLSDLD
ncbi:MAG: anti-sigma B factor antagonist, partial [Synergistales bacterium]|nr:anti-sigma B factor antagonist [Synergistales bacterium]